MFRGQLVTVGGNRHPFVRVTFVFPSLENKVLRTRALIDTGAGRTTLGDAEVQQLGLDPQTLPTDTTPVTTAIGQALTHYIDAILVIGDFGQEIRLTVHEANPHRRQLPSRLGQSALTELAFFQEQRTNRVLLMDQGEAATLALG